MAPGSAQSLESSFPAQTGVIEACLPGEEPGTAVKAAAPLTNEAITEVQAAVIASDEQLVTQNIGTRRRLLLPRMGRDYGFFSTTNGTIDAPSIDPALAGLPAIPPQYTAQGRAVGLVLGEGGHAVNQVPSIQLMLHAGEESVIFLQLVGVADQSVWSLPDPTEPAVVPETAPKIRTFFGDNKDTKRGVLSVIATPALPEEKNYTGRPHKVQLIRPALDPTERQLARQRHPVLRRLGGIIAAAAIVASPYDTSIDATTKIINAPITTAEQVVQPAGTTEHNGIEQAEAYFDEDTLSRSRTAFDTFLRGATEELQTQVNQYGYKANWIDATKLEAVQKAESFEELYKTFAAAIGGLPFTLKVLETSEDVKSPLISPSYTHKPVPDLGSSIKSAYVILDVLNTLDLQMIKKDLPPATFVISGDITRKDNPDTPSDEEMSADGYCYWDYSANFQSGRLSIAIDSTPLETHGNTSHEIGGHALNMGSELKSIIPELNPPEHFYLEKTNDQGEVIESRDYRDTATTTGGIRTVGRDYANVNIGEDIAVTAEEVSNPAATFRLDASTFSEKVLAMVFTLEERYPGFTAHWLQTVNVETEASWEEKLPNAGRRIWNSNKMIILPVAASLFLLLAGSEMRDRPVRRVRRQMGLR